MASIGKVCAALSLGLLLSTGSRSTQAAESDSAMRTPSTLKAKPVATTSSSANRAATPTQTNRQTNRASTQDDPRGCVTPPATGPNRACGKGLSAKITNQCAFSVDARLCLMTPRGWDCSVRWGLKPGESWSNAVCAANGDGVFMSLRSTGADIALDKP